MTILIENIVGVWKLVDFSIHRENGEIFKWKGGQSGILIYAKEGYVSVAQNREINFDNPTDEDLKRTANFYTGTFKLSDDGKSVFHTVLQSTHKPEIGITKQRDLHITEQGILILSGRGMKEIVTLSWEKL